MASHPRTSSVPAGRALSVEEWLGLDEDEEGELVNGRLEEEEVPDAVHELSVSWLIGMLRTWLQGRGFIFGSELKVLVGAKAPGSGGTRQLDRKPFMIRIDDPVFRSLNGGLRS